jgi:hypothetical protein
VQSIQWIRTEPSMPPTRSTDRLRGAAAGRWAAGPDRGRQAPRAAVALLALVATALTACQVVNVYVGTPVAIDPATVITIGETTTGQVLQIFGAPDEIDRRVNGDVFTYSYMRRNERTISIEEPVVTNTQIYTYTTIVETRERLVVLFDRDGTVTGFGYRNGLEAAERPLLPSLPGVSGD